MTKHTQGPWTGKEDDDGEIWVLRPDGQSGLCRMLPPKGKFTHGETLEKIDMHPENLANAHLIAAAPDLLEACKEALEALFNLAPRYRKKGCFGNGAQEDDCICTACILKRAIAKVEGKEV